MKETLIKWSFDPIMAHIPILGLGICYVFIVKFTLENRISFKYFWITSLLFLFLVRSKDFFLQSMNPDEDQWIVTANTLCHNPKAFFSYLIYSDFSRIFTILPLAIFGFFKEFIGYDDSRLINLLFFAAFSFFSYKFLNNYFSKQVSVLSVVLTLISFGLSNSSDYIAYNSEMPVIALFMSSLFVFDYSRINEKKYLFLLSGLLMSISVFAKEQIALTCLLVVGIQSLHLFRIGRVKPILFYYLGLVVPVCTFFLLVYLSNSIDLIKIVVSNIGTYSEIGLKMHSNADAFESMRLGFRLVFLNSTNFALGLASLVGFVVAFRSIAKHKLNDFSIQCVLFLAVFVSILYMTFKPGNYFFHYSIFYYLFFVWFSALFFEFIKSRAHQFWAFTLLCLSVFLIQFSSDDRRLFYPISEVLSKDYIDKDDALRAIEKYVKPGDYMMVWGWENSYYIKSQALRSSFFMYPQFVTSDYPQRQESIALYKNDIEKFKPQIIVEAVGPKRFYFNDQSKFSIEAIDKNLSAIVNAHYNKVESGLNYTIFVRRDS